MRRTHGLLRAAIFVALFGPLAAQSSNPIAVALMTGFNPGANPGMAVLNTRLQTEFGGGSPPFSSQVFTYTNQSGAASFLAAAGASATRVLIGHSWGASSNFSLAQNTLGPMGLPVALQISLDWVSQSDPFSATTPTLPAAILLAYNYHQNSTNLFEPVPSITINGVARNMNLEQVFADTSIIHTSIDNDERAYQLVIERIRELFTPPPYPGTNEHLDLFCRIDTLNVPCNPGAGIAVAGVMQQRAVRNVQAGQWIDFRTISPEGDFANGVYGILGDVFTTGSPPIPVLPGIASSLNPNSMIMLTPGTIQIPPTSFALLPPGGADCTLCWPAGVTGISVVLQTAVIGANAQNGIYATSLGIELRGI